MSDLDDSGAIGRSMLDSVRIAIDAEQLQPTDQGVVALVYGYARELDDAAAIEVEYSDLLGDPDLTADRNAFIRLSKLEDRARASVTWAQVGPKLLAALESLGLSPAARAKLAKGVAAPAADVPEDPRKAALAALRDELAPKRAERMGS